MLITARPTPPAVPPRAHANSVGDPAAGHPRSGGHLDAPSPGATGQAPRLRRTPELCGSSLAAAVRVALRAAHWIEEVDTGRRPAAHLRILLQPALAARWSLGQRRPRSAGRFRSIGPVQMRRRQATPSCSVVLLFVHGGRTLPVAMELRLDGDWSVAEIERPGLPVSPAPRTAWEEPLFPVVLPVRQPSLS